MKPVLAMLLVERLVRLSKIDAVIVISTSPWSWRSAST